MHTSVIVYGRRTPLAKFNGSFATVSAPKLGAHLVSDAKKALNLEGHHIDEIFMGQVLTAGVGQAPARQTALLGGLPSHVCATTVNKVCGSGLKAITLADQSIRLGEARICFAGGQENMTRAPHFLPGSRGGFKFGDVALKDHMQMDGLVDPYTEKAMGHFGEMCAKDYKLSRQSQDEYALESYQRAQKASQSGFFAEEILPVTVAGHKQDTIVTQDEEPFSVDLKKLDKLNPVFSKEGTITAGNASSINDGAALLVMMEEKEAEQRNCKPLARIIASASVAREPEWFTTAPIYCIQKLLKLANLSVSDIDLFEINEAFSVVPMVAMQELKIPHHKVNIWGGAVALGHPIGASGARVLVTLIHSLKKLGQKRGLATLCIGGGEAIGVIIEIC